MRNEIDNVTAGDLNRENREVSSVAWPDVFFNQLNKVLETQNKGAEGLQHLPGLSLVEVGRSADGPGPFHQISEGNASSADIWGKDGLVSKGELATKLHALGFSNDDLKELDKLGQSGADDTISVAAKGSRIFEMAKAKADRHQEPDRLGQIDRLDDLATLYCGFDIFASLDGDASTISRADIAAYNKKQLSSNAPASPTDFPGRLADGLGAAPAAAAAPQASAESRGAAPGPVH